MSSDLCPPLAPSLLPGRYGKASAAPAPKAQQAAKKALVEEGGARGGSTADLHVVVTASGAQVCWHFVYKSFCWGGVWLPGSIADLHVVVTASRAQVRRGGLRFCWRVLGLSDSCGE